MGRSEHVRKPNGDTTNAVKITVKHVKEQITVPTKRKHRATKGGKIKLG